MGAKKIPTKIVKGHPETWAIIIKCIDSRLAHTLGTILRILQESGHAPSELDPENSEHIMKMMTHTDLLHVAGGAKDLATEGLGQEYLLNQISALVGLHNPKVIVLSMHTDCGAYKLAMKPPIGNNWRDFLETEMQPAIKVVERFNLPVIPVVIDHDDDHLHILS